MNARRLVGADHKALTFVSGLSACGPGSRDPTALQPGGWSLSLQQEPCATNCSRRMAERSASGPAGSLGVTRL